MHQERGVYVDFKDLERKAKAGDPAAAFEYGKKSIERGYEEIGRKWLQFAIEKGSVEASLELARILNLAGDKDGARKALVLATNAMHPMSFFTAGMIYLSEQDFQMAEALFRLAHQHGVEAALELAEGMQIFRLGQQIENKQHLKLEAEVENILGHKVAKEGNFEVRKNWWIDWFPPNYAPENLRKAGKAYIRDFDWQISQLTIYSAKRENLSHWNEQVARYGSEEKAAAKVCSDPIALQRAVGFVEANNIAEFLGLKSNMERKFSQLSDDNIQGQLPNYLSEQAKIYLRLNPEAVHRILTMICYLLWSDAPRNNKLFESEAALSFEYENGKLESAEKNHLQELRQEIEDKQLVDFQILERNRSMVHHFSNAFPQTGHTHLKGMWPLAGWNGAGNRKRVSGCTVNFRNGGWHCEVDQFEETDSSSLPEIPHQVIPSRIAKNAVKKVAKKVVKASPPSKKVIAKKMPAKKIAPAKKITNINKAMPAKKIVKKAALPIKKSNPPMPSFENLEMNGSELTLSRLIDIAVQKGDLPIPKAAPGWQDRKIEIGPIGGRVRTSGWMLLFTFSLGKISGKGGVSNTVEKIAAPFPPEVRISGTLAPQPELTLHIAIPGTPTDDDRAVTQTFIQVANVVVDVLRVAIETGTLIEPTEQALGAIGLVKPAFIVSKHKSRNWNDRNLGGKLLYGESQ
ncbi:MAG: hypothetical protein RLZZ330_2 [Actinomycetota bacterium]